jgi:putative inorganic carbon (HCO3(-)) transporter
VSTWADKGIDWGVAAALSTLAILALAIALLPLTWATLLLVGGIVVLVTLVHPQFGVLLIFPAVPFGSLWQVGVGAMNVGATEVLVALVLAAWLMRMVARREIRLGFSPWAFWLTLFLGVLCLSMVGTTSLSHSVKEILKWVEVLGLYLLVAQEMDARWTRALLAVLLGTGALVALHGIYQFLFQVGPEGFVLFDRFMRAHGTFEQPNPYGGYLGLTLPLALGLGMASVLRADGEVKWPWLVWAGGCGALMLTALVMSWSRGAWLGFAGAVATMVIAVVVRSGRAAVLATVLVVLALYTSLLWGLARIPASIVQRFSDFVPYLGVLDVEGREITDANFAILERVAHWQAAWDMWTDHPWLGVGIGNFEPIYPRYALPLWPLPLGHAHNYYLNIAAEAGAIGLLAYLFLWSAAVLGAWQAARRVNGWCWGVALGVLGVLVHLGIHSLVDNLFVHGMYLQLAILMGIVSASSRRSDNIDSTHHSH